jgi:2-isopropylmalate synthase
LRGGSGADSAAYVQVQEESTGKLLWGCGVDPSIEMAGLKALICAWNLLHTTETEEA